MEKTRWHAVAHDRPRVAELASKLAAQGYRITPQRLYILKALVDAADHPDAESIYAAVREQCPTTSLATVYNTLNTLKELGEVLELEFGEGSNRYDGRRPRPHPHVVCRGCGRIEDVELEEMAALEACAAANSGFLIQSQRVEFYGLCRECQAGQE